MPSRLNRIGMRCHAFVTFRKYLVKMIRTLRIYLFTIGLCAALSTGAQIQNHLKTLDSALIQLHNQAMFNGVALVAEKGRIIYQKHFGFANLEGTTPLSSSSSLTWPQTASNS